MQTLLVFLALAAGMVAECQSQIQKRSPDKVASVIARLATAVVEKNVSYAQVNPKWVDNTEIMDVKNLPLNDRLGLLVQILALNNNNEEKMFRNVSNREVVLKALVGVRLQTFKKLRTLIAETDNLSEQIISNYIESEYLDLRILSAGRMNMNTYAAAQKTRVERFISLIDSDRDVVAGARSNSGLAQAVAAKTILISLMELCIVQLDVCESL